MANFAEPQDFALKFGFKNDDEILKVVKYLSGELTCTFVDSCKIYC